MYTPMNTRWQRHDWFGFFLVATIVGAAMLLGYWTA